MAGVQFNPTQGPSQGVGAQVVMPSVGITGGAAQVRPVRAAKDWYADGMDAELGGNIPEFLNEVFAEPLAAAAQERVWRGFADAAAGMTAEQIREQQPWYTKMFGPTQYEAGATMYETQNKVNELALDWARRMPELRELPAEEVTSLLMEQMQGMQGDNPFANMVLQQSMMRQFAPMLEQHTKERVAWQQAELVRLQVRNSQSSGTVLQTLKSRAASLGSDHPMQQEIAANMTAAETSFLDALATARLQPDDSVKAFITTTMRSHMREGNFYAVELMLDNGVLANLSAEEAERMERAYVTSQSQYRNRFAADNPEFEKMLAKAQALKNMGIGGEPMMRMMSEINQTYSAMTGAPLPYFDSDQVAAFAGDATASWLRRFERLEDKQFSLSLRAMDAEEKALAEARNTAQLTGFFQQGAIGEAMNMKGIEKGDADRASSALFNQAVAEGKLQQAVGYLIYNQNNPKASYVNDQIASQLQNNLQNSMDEDINDAFQQQYRLWRTMYYGTGFAQQGDDVVETDNSQGRATAIAYYTPAVNAKMVEFDRKIEAGMPADRAYKTTFSEWVANGTPDFRGLDSAETKQNRQDFLAAIDRQSAGLFSRMFGNGFELHPSARILLANRVGSYWEQLGSDGLRPEHRANSAVNLALRGGRMEIAGGHVLSYGRSQQPLTKYLDDPDGQRTSVLFDSVLRARLKQAGTTPDGNSVIINRLSDESGNPVYAVHVETDEGFFTVDLRGSDLRDYESKHLRTREEREAAIRAIRAARPQRIGLDNDTEPTAPLSNEPARSWRMD